jgi:hypothetical protein
MAEESKESEQLEYTTDELVLWLLPPNPSLSRAVACYSANLTDPHVIEALNSERFVELQIAGGSVDTDVFSLVDVIKDGPYELTYYRVLFLFASLRDELTIDTNHETLANAISGGGFDPCSSGPMKETLEMFPETFGRSLFKLSTGALSLKMTGKGMEKTVKRNALDMHAKITEFYVECENNSALVGWMARHKGETQWLVWAESLPGSDIVMRLVFRHASDDVPEIIILVEYPVDREMQKELAASDREFNCDFNDLT